MSQQEENAQPTHDEAEAAEASVVEDNTTVELEYKGKSQILEPSNSETTVAFFSALTRAAVKVDGKVKKPLELREALETLYRVVKSDNRRAPKDRSAYLAHKQKTAGSAGQNAFEAQRQYFEWLGQNDLNSWFVLDPVITAHPDRLLFEVFSKDESSYASLAVDWDALELDATPSYGTTNIDLSEDFHDAMRRMRSYHTTSIAIGKEAVSITPAEGAAPVTEKKIDVPNSWLRGFLQVQASATLPATKITIAPIDLYNVLRHLRMNADQKKGGRAIRVELMPGECPRLVIEPTEEVISTEHEVFTGRTAQVIRIWGRRRWMMLTPLLPLVTDVEIHMLGTGLPNFCVLRCGPITFTLGLTGFTAANWSQALGLDTLLPRSVEVNKNLEKVLEHLEKSWFDSAANMATSLSLNPTELRHALQTGCQNGQIMYDLAQDVYRLRPLLESIDLDALEFRNDRERLAHDLLHDKGGKVKLLSRNHIPGTGVQYVGEVTVDADRRSYRVEMTIDEEGRVRRVDDTSPFYRKHQLKEGPSAPLIALRLKIAELQKELLEARSKGKIDYETRTYVKRVSSDEKVYQISLEKKHIRVKFGLRRYAKLRSQNLTFNSVEDARHAYFARIAELEEKGYMDATAPV